MSFARLLRSSAMKQALLLVGAVALVNLGSLGIAWVTLRADAKAAVEEDVSQEMAGFDVTATPATLRTFVSARARVTDPSDTIFIFLGYDGRSTGNANAYVEDQNVRFEAANETLPLSGVGYVSDIERLSGGILIVGKSLDPVARLDDTFLVLLAFSLLPTVLIALGLGALIARRSAARVGEIERVLNRIASGDLAARVAGAGEGDEIARIADRVNRMAGKQQAATEALRQVTTDIAHDLRTPLQRIGVTLQELDALLPEGPAQDLASAAQAEADRAVGVFRGLLQIAQIEGGAVREGFGPVDLTDVVRRIAELYEPAAEDRGDQIALDLPEAPVRVIGDADLIGQALANLVENALRHVEPGGAIRISVEEQPGEAQLSVADDGPGIPEAERDKVLQRLYRLERSRTTPGNGLGLALVAAVAEAHGAGLRLSDANPGLVVTLDFPV